MDRIALVLGQRRGIGGQQDLPAVAAMLVHPGEGGVLAQEPVRAPAEAEQAAG